MNIRDSITMADVMAVKHAVINDAVSGNNTLVAAVSGKRIVVLQLLLISAGAMTVRFESGAGGTALTGQMTVVEGSGFSLPFSPLGHFSTDSGDLLNLELSAAVRADGYLKYIEV